MRKYKQRLTAFRKDSNTWRTVFDLPKKRKRLRELQILQEQPDFWEHKEEAARLSKEFSDLREEISNLDAFKSDIRDLAELAKLADEESHDDLRNQLSHIAKRVDQEEIRMFLGGKYDKGNAVITITAGAGGQDAQDWAAMLSRMYERYCERKGWKVNVVHQSFGDMGPDGRIGVKQVVFETNGKYAFGLLKKESGVHRLVRISPFSAKQLRHTSFASVEAMPQIDMAEEKDIEIKPEDLQVDLFRSSGPGGQNVNKRETAVRLTHIPTGIAVTSQTQRSQQQNREKAMEILAAKLYVQKEQEREKELAKLKGQRASIEWGSQIRSYVLHPYQLVRDHRTEYETSNVRAVLDGDLDELIEAELKQ